MRLIDADKVTEEIQRDIDYPVKNENERYFRMALRYARNLIEQYSFTAGAIPVEWLKDYFSKIGKDLQFQMMIKVWNDERKTCKDCPWFTPVNDSEGVCGNNNGDYRRR